MIATPQDQRRGKLVRRKGLEQLPDGLVLSVLHFSSDPDRGALIFASKAIATRLREERETLVAGLFSTDSGDRLRAANRLKSLTDVENAPIGAVVKTAGVVPRFVEFLNGTERDSDSIGLQFAAINVLGEIAEAGHPDVVVEAGAIPIFCRLISSAAETPDDPESVEFERRRLLIWALGSIAEDGPTSRERVFREGVLATLFNMLDEDDSDMLGEVTATLNSLCESTLPDDVFDSIRPALPLLTRLIHCSPNEEVLIDACGALGNLATGEREVVEARVHALMEAETDYCRRLVELMGHPSPDVRTNVLAAVAGVASGSVAQLRVILDLHVLSDLLPFLTDCETDARGEACRVLGHVAASESVNVQDIIDANFIPPLVQLLSATEVEIQEEVVWALHAIAQRCSIQQIEVLVDAGCVVPLCELLSDEVYDPSGRSADHLVRLLLTLRRIVLNDDDETNRTIYSKAGAKIKTLLKHTDIRVRQTAVASRVRIIQVRAQNTVIRNLLLQVDVLGVPFFRVLSRYES
mmetsp:Transcript_25471/g.84420  ORF Transcript_25471/g.84420 Transcript_25471/m.84420 type:complete len:523 (+) Transcript_25471:118-1686(+)